MYPLFNVAFIFISMSTVAEPAISPPSGAYIHIPFCRRRCFYCNFPVIVLGERESTQKAQGEVYTDLLLREISASCTSLSDQRQSLPRPLQTIYFGGGTPSLLPVECLEKLIKELDTRFGISNDAEITLEMDPGTFDRAKLKSLWNIGFNRLSVGIQSFDELILQKCGRAHNSLDVQSAVQSLQSSDFRDNFSIDLISSLPYLTPELWRATLLKAVDSGAAHISVYDLQVEDKTAFGRWYTPGTFPLPSDEVSANMYRTAVEVLTSHQFEHYEVSNYARHGKRSRHNQKYWKCDSTLGFGMGAASFIAGNRFSRPGTLPEYVKWLDRLDSEGFEGATREELEEEEDEKEEDDDDNAADDVSNSARINVASSPEETSGSDVDVLEVVMLALRTADGLDLDDLLQRYGKDVVGKVQRALAPYVSGGLVIYKSHAVSLAQQELGTNGSDDGTGTCNKITSEIQETVSSASAASPEAKNIVRLVDPDGFIVSNDIISSVFAELT